MDKANHLVKKYRKNINPPYSRKDFPTIGGTIIAFLLIPLILVFFQPAKDIQTVASQNGNLVGVSKQEKFVSNEVLVKLKDSAKKRIKPKASPGKIGVASLENTNKNLKVKEFKQITPKSKKEVKSDVSNWYEAKLPGDKKVISGKFNEETGQIVSKDSTSAALQEAINRFKADPNVEVVEPNFQVTIDVTPNDPYYSSSGSWGQSYPDLWGMKKINMAAAWNQTTGSGSVIVADIDTGVDRNHEDIKDNMWVNSGETPNNGIDDDGNGYKDDYYGWDWVNNDNNPMDDHGHGTHVAGTIAGVGNNAKGVVGVNWTSKIMALKFLSSGGSGSLSNGIAALKYAADMGAKVSSNSWGCRCNSKAMDDAVAYEHDRGMVMVAAAGNNNGDALDHSPSSADRAIAVAATDYADRKAGFSNWGEKIDVAAPGVDTLSTRAVVNPMCTASRTVGGKYCRVSGTSMATPHVAGLAALLWAEKPSLKNEEVRQIIRGGTDDLGTVGKDKNFGYGRINASNSMSLSATRPLAPIITTPSSRTTIAGASYEIYGGVPGPNFSSYKIEAGKGRLPTSWTVLVSSTNQVNSGLLATVNTTSLSDGAYIIRITATNASGKKYQFQVHDVEIDNQDDDPTVYISSPRNGDAIAGTSYVYAVATDDIGVSKVELHVDGVLAGTFSLYYSTTYRYRWDTTSVADGSRTLIAKAYDTGGHIVGSSPITVTVANNDSQSPSIPTNIVGRQYSQTYARISWSASTDNTGVSGYRVYRDGVLARNTSYTYVYDSGRVLGRTYRYRVSAYDAKGNESAKSQEVSVVIRDMTKPNAPGGFRAKVASGPQINLAWYASSDNVGVVGYRIYRNGALIKRVPGVKYSDRSVGSGRTYYYYVRAYDAAGNVSNKSTTVKVTTPGTGAPRKLGDLNSDGRINIFDLSILLTRWRTTSRLADLNNSGRVDIFDLSILLSRWGR
jgi:subtilisin family serine protease/fibronectin type 3 domain-containing protein